MFEALFRLEASAREHAPRVARDLERVVSALESIALGVATIARVLQTNTMGGDSRRGRDLGEVQVVVGTVTHETDEPTG